MDPLDPQRADCHETIYEYITSADSDCADIDETEYREYVRADMLKLTSQRYKRGLLKRKTEYTDEKRLPTICTIYRTNGIPLLLRVLCLQ